MTEILQKTRALWPAVILLLTLTACGRAANAGPSPPTVHYGQDVCELCGMIISEERYAAAFVTGDGHGHVFDDIGDLFQFHLEEPENVTAFFVHDYDGKGWIRAETASYVQSEELSTPMLSGLAAFASLERAQSLAAELQGQVLTFDEVLTHYQEMASLTLLRKG